CSASSSPFVTVLGGDTGCCSDKWFDTAWVLRRSPHGGPGIRESTSVPASTPWHPGRQHGSVLWLADLPEGVADGGAEPASQRGVEVGDQAVAGPAHLLDGEHHAGRGIVVVVGDGDGPRDRPVLRRLGGGIVDRAA